MEHVILVDPSDRETGIMEKMEAHHKGLLHRAFSVLLFNARGELLVQKRARTKYHSAGLWSNTCCSHPRPDEPMEDAIRRKLMQEMGIEAQTEYSHKFAYKVSLEGVVENEMDHVFLGEFNGEPVINTEEVEDWKYIGLSELQEDVARHPDHYSYWFKLILAQPEIGRSSGFLF